MKLRSSLAFLALALFGAVLFPAATSAQQSNTETMTIQVQGTTPTGASIIGTIVVQRSCNGNTADADVSFNGMFNGQQAAFSGKVRDTWLGEGKEDIEILSTDVPNLSLNNLPLRTLSLRQTSPNTITLNGVPLAIDKPLQAPCSGNTTYVVTSPGQGSKMIQQLPNTASAPAANVVSLHAASWYELPAAMVLAGVVVLLVGVVLARWHTSREQRAK